MAEKEYIEREAVLDHLNKIWETTDNWYEEDTPESPENMIRCVESIPAADVAPVVHAHWCYDSENGVYNCSRCGNAETSDGRYCSYCGAKMDGGKHG